MTYKNCKRLIEYADKNGTKTPEYVSDMKEKLDIFLLNDRITHEEYVELVAMLDKGMDAAEETATSF